MANDKSSGFTYVQAKAANESIKVQKARRQLQRLEAQYIEKESVVHYVLELGADARALWHAWIDEVTPRLSLAWDADPEKIQSLLIRGLELQFAELGEFNFTLIDPDMDDIDL